MKEFQDAEKEDDKEITIDIYVRNTQDKKRELANKLLGSKIKIEEEEINIINSNELPEPEPKKEEIEFEVEPTNEEKECILMEQEDVRY
jgi:hypothetical protein